MKFYMRRPVYRAVKFDGTTDAAEQIQDMTGATSYTITKVYFEVKAQFAIPGRILDVGTGQHVVLAPDGIISVVDHMDFRRAFEKAEA